MFGWSIWAKAEPKPTPVTDELRAAAHLLGIDTDEVGSGFLLQAKIIRRLAEIATASKDAE